MAPARLACKPVGSASVLAIGTATPPTVVKQDSFPDYYFGITASDHMVDLKEKFTRICKNAMIEKRHFVLTEEMLKANPDICSFNAPSLDARQELLDVEVPRLGMEASLKAISDWGRSKFDITHVILCSSGGASMPGADLELLRFLGLPLSTKRFMLYQQGCYGGGTVLRLAKDIAENNLHARILAVCSEVTSIGFRGPSELHIGNLVGQAVFADGASAVIVGADPLSKTEHALFEIVSTSQVALLGSEDKLQGKLREGGLMYTLKPEIPHIIGENIEKVTSEALDVMGVDDPNDAFWIVHAGGRAVLDVVEQSLGLRAEKLGTAREVLRDYGNTWSSCVFFIMDAMCRRSTEKGLGTAGEGLEWGMLLGFGPGLTFEIIVLRCP